MARSRYREVVDRLAAEIRAGRLTPATRLPTHRELAQSHHLALATASRVYAELETMGLVVGEVGRGTFVRDLSYLQNSTVDQLPAVPGATRQAECFGGRFDGKFVVLLGKDQQFQALIVAGDT